MRAIVVSDIHANLTALEAVIVDVKTASPDLVIVGGDLVGSGSRPAHVIDRIRELDWRPIFGNSDEMLWNGAAVDEFFAPLALQRWRSVVDRSIVATNAALGVERVEWLRRLPFEWRNDDLAVVHASPKTAWRSPAANASDSELLDTYEPLHARRVIYGHIHQPFVRVVGGSVIANSGSVGLPYDGDSRASYAIVDPTEIQIRRVDYDIEKEIAMLFEYQCPDAEWIAATLRAGAPVPVS